MKAKKPEDMADELLADVCGDTCPRAQAAVLEAFRAYGNLVRQRAMEICDGANNQGESNPLQIKRWIEAESLP